MCVWREGNKEPPDDCAGGGGRERSRTGERRAGMRGVDEFTGSAGAEQGRVLGEMMEEKEK